MHEGNGEVSKAIAAATVLIEGAGTEVNVGVIFGRTDEAEVRTEIATLTIAVLGALVTIHATRVLGEPMTELGTRKAYETRAGHLIASAVTTVVGEKWNQTGGKSEVRRGTAVVREVSDPAEILSRARAEGRVTTVGDRTVISGAIADEPMIAEGIRATVNPAPVTASA